MDVAKLMVVVGLVVAGLGFVMWLGVPLGRLPGDLVIRRGNTTVYVPITTSIVLSVLLTVLVSLWRR